MALPTIHRQVELVPVVRLSRTFSVSAAHRLHSIYLTDEENQKLYGPCNRQYGHGHNYKITVSLVGQVDPHTGMVVNLRVLKSIAQQYVADLLDHRNLDMEVDYFIKRPSTTENLAVFIWQQMRVGLRDMGLPDSLLDNITIEETDANCCISSSSFCHHPHPTRLPVITMDNDTKPELEMGPNALSEIFTPEIKAEVTALVQAALSKIQPSGFDCSINKASPCTIRVSSVDTETEADRKYKEIISAFDAKLAESDRQLQSAYHDLSDAQDQLEKQRAKSVQLEQRILQMSEAEGILKSTLTALHAERDSALSREREALLCRDRAEMHNAQLSSQISELQGDLDLKTAELNDASYKQQRLESLINELNKENASLRQTLSSQGDPTGAPTQSGVATSPQTGQPPANLYFSVPMAPGGRRHTAPNAFAPVAPTILSIPPTSRLPKRARADSNASPTSDSTQSRASSGSSTNFALRPIKVEHSASNPLASTEIVPPNHNGDVLPRYKAYSSISPVTPVSPYYTQQTAFASPAHHQNQPPYQAPPGVPQGSTSALPAMAASQVKCHPPQSFVSAPAHTTKPAPQWGPIQEFISQMFAFTVPGFPECKICKVRPMGPNRPTLPPTVPDLLAHAEQHHGKTMAPRPTQRQQTQP
ncbi:6-pyruvoyltetrahydropterin synthase [Rhizoctonia solani]|uniref:6-pyruvoyltetrahydropterin synthase n=1 Tax=Rhizoctonia solani TaxID=456999 RepID=A0A8H7H9P6_9AGAM|nr:6-pyruvoyltetrahydropterin synthase [Rhizoctonia solani]